MKESKHHVDYSYRFSELVDEMNKSIETSQTVINQQRELMRIIESSNKSDKFKDFLKSLEVSTKQQEAKTDDCRDRMEMIKTLLNYFKDETTSETTIAVTHLLLQGLGLERQPENTKTEE